MVSPSEAPPRAAPGDCRRKRIGATTALRGAVWAAAACLAACAADTPAGGARAPQAIASAGHDAGRTTERHVTLLAFNDFHGRLEPPDGGVPVLLADGREASVGAGGAAYLASLIHRLQATRPNTLVVAAGDLVGASPLASAAFHDEPSVDALGLMGLQLSSVGNHEFDHGRGELLRLQRGGCAPAVPGRSDRGVVDGDTCIGGATFPGAQYGYLAANVLDAASGAPLLPATSLRTVGGVRIGFIGLTLQATPGIVTPAGVAGLAFLPEVETVNRLVPGLRRDGADAIVVLIHQGGQTTATHADDRSCPGFSGEIVAIADAFDPAVAVVVSAHTHQEYVCRRPNGRLVTSAGSYGRYLTEIDMTMGSRADGSTRVVAAEARTHVVLNGRPVRGSDGQLQPLPPGLEALPPDPAVQKVVARASARTEALRSRPVGPARGPLTRVASPAGESSLGDAVADAYLRSTATAGAVLAFTNPGGLRADLLPEVGLRADLLPEAGASLHTDPPPPTGTGLLRYGQVYTALPFGNTLVTMDLTGAQLAALLAQQWQADETRVLQVSAGFSYRWRADNGRAEVVPGSLRLNGAPVRPEAVYRVTVNSYMASGGDGFSVLAAGMHRVEGPVDLDAMVALVQSGALAADPATATVRIERIP